LSKSLLHPNRQAVSTDIDYEPTGSYIAATENVDDVEARFLRTPVSRQLLQEER
jgi:hypothetical protein